MSSDDAEPAHRLAGGNMGPVLRRGDEVLRVAGPWTPIVHRLLTHLAVGGLAGIVPEPRGYADGGREVLSFIPGFVPVDPLPAWLWANRHLSDTARLLRRLHDATVGFDGTGGQWRSPVREPVEVVCHNDFTPFNLVFVHEQVAGVIDFDYCSPGPRVWDLALLACRLVPLTRPAAGDPVPPAERAGRLRLLTAAYGRTGPGDADGAIDPAEIVRVAQARLDDLAEFSDRAAVELDRPVLREHAVGYRLDARWLRDLVAAGWPGD